MSLALIKQGYRLLNDDLAYIGGPRGNEVRGVLEKVNFTGWTAEQFPECAKYFSDNGLDVSREKQPLDIRKIYGDKSVLDRGTAALIIMLKKDHESPLMARRLDTFALLYHMYDAQILPVGPPCWQAVLDVISHVRAFELFTGPDPVETAEWIHCNWEQLILNSSTVLQEAQTGNNEIH